MVDKFQYTDYGMIPREWIIKSIQELLDDNTIISHLDGNHGALYPKSHEFTNYGVPYIAANDFVRGSVSFENCKYLSQSRANLFKKGIAKDGDVLFAHNATVGPVSLLKTKLDFVILSTTATYFRCNQSRISNIFLLYVMQSEFFVKQYKSVMLQSTRAQVPITAQRKFKIFVPTKTEQTAIATALNDADNLISELEKLIAKKKLIKQGAMQELLNGEKRLNGYKDKWIKKSFPEVCWFQEGPGLRDWQFTKSGLKVINVTNLENGYLNLERTDRHISIEEFKRMYQHFAIDENDIVIASSGNSYGKVAVVRKQDLPLLMNTSVIRFKALRGLDYGFLLSFLNSSLFKNQIELMITGGAQPNFGPYHLKKILISIPKSIDEQKAISEILINMDNEIYGLETKLSKYKMIKQGMMQNLLTGMIRLV